ncbi:MAG TPA: hypothetical protein GXZ20_00160 [Halanaerobiaceae bacterium]|jgi:hypothetical protein|nr:hypothetical protein [Bacillota bacterium]HHU91533.1 hypothetical protein [Halanaerobiaceae bacterium]HOA41252.1 hypothetical protein [Halanaerobiales bacterium]HPZ63260.1 hypothetical protein [Halanaerobiales bacterium]HQD04486.1 hypothetical protein [Halanaerobiales bacterium]
MDLFLAIFFFVLSVAGLVLGSNAGVFAGLALFSLQVVKLLREKIYGLIIVIIAGIAGIAYFAFNREWLLLSLFIVIHSYNYWVYQNIKENKED